MKILRRRDGSLPSDSAELHRPTFKMKQKELK